MLIRLRDILPLQNLKDYKIHFARWNKAHQPLDVFTRNRHEWQEWQEYRPKRDEFNRPFIFSLASFYHEPDMWLFGGVYKVVERRPDRYVVELSQVGELFIGRLKLHSTYRERATRVKMEGYFDDLHVAEILPEPFAGRAFPGYEEIDLSFDELGVLVKNERMDWRAALENVKGIYLITDIKTGKRYVGKASGEGGIWARWRSYSGTGHGGNVELQAIVKSGGQTYCRENFRFALLEYRSAATPDVQISKREAFWKQLLLTRGAQGLNRN
jgi:hypothetical protein